MECAADSSFDSKCYTYIAAYQDFMAFFVRATEEDRMRAFCLLSLEADRVAKRLATAEPTKTGYQVTQLIMDEFCNWEAREGVSKYDAY